MEQQLQQIYSGYQCVAILCWEGLGVMRVTASQELLAMNSDIFQ